MTPMTIFTAASASAPASAAVDEVGYPIWTILIQGAAWGNRHVSESETIAEVERMIAYEAKLPRVNTWDGRLYRAYQGFDNAGKTAVVVQPVKIEIRRGMNINHRGTPVAAWLAGERTCALGTGSCS